MINIRKFKVVKGSEERFGRKSVNERFTRKVEFARKDLDDFISRWFNMNSSWDRAVMVTLFTYVLSYVAIVALGNKEDLMPIIKDFLDENLNQYKKQTQRH